MTRAIELRLRKLEVASSGPPRLRIVWSNTSDPAEWDHQIDERIARGEARPATNLCVWGGCRRIIATRPQRDASFRANEALAHDASPHSSSSVAEMGPAFLPPGQFFTYANTYWMAKSRSAGLVGPFPINRRGRTLRRTD
jgi:hypothetical protein